MSHGDEARTLERTNAGFHWLMGSLGFVLGGILGEEVWTTLVGTALGLLFASRRALGLRVRALERALASLDPAAQGVEAAPQERSDSGAAAARVSVSEPAPERAASPAAAATAASEARPPPRAATVAPRRARVSSVDRALAGLRGFFLGGNTLVRVGLLVLLVGLTLLARYAAQHAMFPIEARLAFGALVGLALVAFGYRERASRRGFAMTLQGGGVAALYLIVFFAFKVYLLIPAGLAFGLFVALAIATIALSVAQKSEPLLVIGSLGGFLAPVVASTGSGSHVVLFSYYLLLVASIAAVAWRESWRSPALVAFFSTYGVAGVWGVLRYEPALFASTQPFVLAFLVLFTGIGILHAIRFQDGRRQTRHGVVDGTLIFGTPFVSILIQAALVRDRELGLAFSAAGFAVFYVVAALLVSRIESSGSVWSPTRVARDDDTAAGRHGEESAGSLRPMIEAFVALGVGFATMAIPFAFDDALTTAIAWALEGAGLYWVGARQGRQLPRVAGLVLQPLAVAAFVVRVAFDPPSSADFIPVVNGRALTCLALAAAGIFIARCAHVRRERVAGVEYAIAQALGVAGLLWFSFGSLAEIDQFVPARFSTAAVVVWLAATMAVLDTGAARAGWRPGRGLALLGLPFAFLVLVHAVDRQSHLLGDGGGLAWPLLFAVFVLLWLRQARAEPTWLLPFRDGCVWLVALFVGLAFEGVARSVLELVNDWRLAGFVAGVAFVLLIGLALVLRARPPFDVERERGMLASLGPVVAFALMSVAALQLAATGDATPLPHVPLLNPVDLAAALVVVAAFGWWRVASATIAEAQREQIESFARLPLAALAFLVLNGVLVRAVHRWTGVPHEFDALWDSVAMQATLSIAWTLVGVVGMLLASRKGSREGWIGFAGLLAVVVVKLFVVDLAQLDTIARIATFLVVGLLLLALGYLSPVPPARREIPEGGPDPSAVVDPERRDQTDSPPRRAV